jgi:3-keto-5-aminohexanoate cleavage enzyme
MRSREIIIAVAPVGTSLPEGTEAPLSPGEVARQTADCARTGASVVHLHVRDASGRAASELDAFTETVRRIRDEEDIIIQGSTGGLGEMSAAERCVSLDAEEVETASLNMGSTNFFDSVYLNSPADIRFWAERMRQRGIVPELEIFSPDMIAAAESMASEGLLRQPLRCSACLGIPGAMPADPRYLCFISSIIPQGGLWGVLHHGMEDHALLLQAAAMGASWLRVGFEDSPYYGGGRQAGSNRELVAELRELLERSGYTVASAARARELLRLPERSEGGKE